MSTKNTFSEPETFLYQSLMYDWINCACCSGICDVGGVNMGKCDIASMRKCVAALLTVEGVSIVAPNENFLLETRLTR